MAVLAIGFIAFFVFDLQRFITIDALRQHRAALTAFVEAHVFLAGLSYVAAYALATALSLPAGLFLTVTGGFLFGTLVGTPLAVLGATLGATLLFLIARTALGDVLRGRLGDTLERMAEGFRRDAFSYLLFLRLVPLFPFFAVNLAPALLGVGLRPFVLATLIGILPGAFVYANVGAGLGSLFDTQGEISLENFLTWEIILALVGLAVLSLIPIAYRHLKGQSGVNTRPQLVNRNT